MKPSPTFNIARTCAKALRKRSTLYATEAMTDDLFNGNKAWVEVTKDGVKYRVTVESIG